MFRDCEFYNWSKTLGAWIPLLPGIWRGWLWLSIRTISRGRKSGKLAIEAWDYHKLVCRECRQSGYHWESSELMKKNAWVYEVLQARESLKKTCQCQLVFSKLFWDKSRRNYALLFSGLATFSIFLQCPKISQAANSDWLKLVDHQQPCEFCSAYLRIEVVKAFPLWYGRETKGVFSSSLA